MVLNLLINLIIFAIIAGLLYYLVGLLPIPEPFSTMIKVGAILICILLVLALFMGGLYFHVVWTR